MGRIQQYRTLLCRKAAIEQAVFAQTRWGLIEDRVGKMGLRFRRLWAGTRGLLGFRVSTQSWKKAWAPSPDHKPHSTLKRLGREFRRETRAIFRIIGPMVREMIQLLLVPLHVVLGLVLLAMLGFWKWTAGYGHKPHKAIPWLIFVVAVGWFVYDNPNQPRGAYAEVTPRDPFNYTVAPDDIAGFSPLMFSIDNTLPFIDLGARERWMFNRSAGEPLPPHDGAKSDEPEKVMRFNPADQQDSTWLYKLLRLVQNVQVISGWVLGTIAVAGFTGLLRKD